MVLHGIEGLMTKDTVEVIDEPSLRIKGYKSILNIGNELDMTAAFNTGYPYDANDVKGTETYEYDISTVDLEGNTVESLLHGGGNIRFSDLDKTLIAHRDSFNIKKKLELGRYRVSITNNWAKIADDAQRQYDVAVFDTLRVTTKLDKESYDLRSDKEAKIDFTLDYGNPYILTIEPDVKPTIRIFYSINAVLKDTTVVQVERTNLLGQTYMEDSLIIEERYLYEDSLILAHDTLATNQLFHRGQIVIPFSDITDEILLNNSVPVDSTEEFPRYLFAQMRVMFNGGYQYKNSLQLLITMDAGEGTGIAAARKENSDEDAFYDLQGRRLNGHLPRGVYVNNRKKMLIK